MEPSCTGIKFETDPSTGEIKFTIENKNDKCLKETTKFTIDFNGETRSYFASYWIPQSIPVKAAVFLVHGYAEYISFGYEELAQTLCSHGLMVFGHDHIGHGRSSGPRVQVDAFDEYVDPVIAHVEAVKEWPTLKSDSSRKPIFILGHSMGGLITLFTVFKRQDLFKGMILNGPLILFDPDIATPLKRFLARLMQGIIPSFSLGYMEHWKITRDKDFVKKVEEDPLVWHGGFKARHSYVLLTSGDYALNNLSNIHLPTLILQGTEDKLVLPKGAEVIHDTISSKDKTLKLYEDAFHNMFVEQEEVKTDALKLTIEFLEKNI